VNSTPRPLYPWERDPVPFYRSVSVFADVMSCKLVDVVSIYNNNNNYYYYYLCVYNLCLVFLFHFIYVSFGSWVLKLRWCTTYWCTSFFCYISCKGCQTLTFFYFSVILKQILNSLSCTLQLRSVLLFKNRPNIKMCYLGAEIHFENQTGASWTVP
jgi:hypothetical protein